MSARRLVVASLAVLLAATPAGAEDNGLGSFFSHLFGGGSQPPPSPSPSQAAPRPSATTARKPRKRSEPREARDGKVAPAASATPPPTASRFVYVLGDSLAVSAADGMAADLQSQPDIGIVDRARDASGLVRDDYFDWPKAARDLVAPKEPAASQDPAKDKTAKDAKPDKPKIDAVVVMIGLNDMQQMRDGKDFVDPLSDRWKAAYAQRIQAVVASLRAARVPVIWVGLPPMRSDKFNAQMIELNQLFKTNAERAGAKFVDIFDDFADQGGGFDAFGPNVEGQNVKLRGPDGIHLTSAGGKKLAHFVDIEVLAALGQGARPPSDDIAALPPDLGKAAEDINEQIRREMGAPPSGETRPADNAASPTPKPPPRPEAGAIASLAARPSSPGAVLATPVTALGGEAEQRLRQGDPPPAAPGRADDFSR